jgi:hypothetical protein
MSRFKIEYLNEDGSEILEFRFVALANAQCAIDVAKVGMGEANAAHGAQAFRVRDQIGDVVALGPPGFSARAAAASV